MAVRRGTSNTNDRGSAEQRRRRKQFLLDTFGNGVTCVCSTCPAVLTFETITVDRIVPGCEGGRYTRDNIRPQCALCASRQGAQLAYERRLTRDTTSSILDAVVRPVTALAESEPA